MLTAWGRVLARDRTYEKVKSVLWDMFPTWEDDHYDRYFKEMMWASLGGMDCPPPFNPL